ncbi:hypothetical protein G8A07_23505 [Roseateles sp. DAIF2]|uniref:histidine kinase n=1 Tax=Roseateles sp. DAIF2 TaxID=2714952 RepID=UPI0018A30A26|nr:histidine kinase [Roseateles sp. DAIF2]QPF75587.1 hypothetical protein G8A07_23505 [Roseateles sp. DAIF2]
MSAVLPTPADAAAGGPLRHLWASWRSLRRRELVLFLLMGLLYGLIDVSALAHVDSDARWLHALTRQLFSPVIVTLLLMLCWLPAARSRPDHPHRLWRLGLATLLGSMIAMACLWQIVAQLDWPSIGDLLRERKGEKYARAVPPWASFLGDSLQVFIPSMLTVALLELLARRKRAQASLQQLLHEQSVMARRAMAARLAVMQAQVEPQFLFDILVDVEQAYAAGDAEAPIQMERLIRHLRVALPRLREMGGTPESEAELLESYLAVVAGRRKARVSFQAHWPEALRGAPLPPMLLLPLLQRALRLAAPALPGRCSFSVEPLDGGLRLLLGFDRPDLCGEDAELRDLSQRLQALSGGPTELRCRSSEDATLFILELKP